MDWYNTGSRRSQGGSKAHRPKSLKAVGNLEADQDPEAAEGEELAVEQLVSVDSTPREVDNNQHDDTESGFLFIILSKNSFK